MTLVCCCYVVAPPVEPARSFDKVAARLAFRRRSISENTYDRSFQLHQNVDDDGTSGGTLSADPSKRAVGVVCSNEDLKAIVHLHKRRQSPAVSPTSELAPTFASSGAVDVADRTLSFVTAASNDRLSVVEVGPESTALRGPLTSSTLAKSSVITVTTIVLPTGIGPRGCYALRYVGRSLVETASK